MSIEDTLNEQLNLTASIKKDVIFGKSLNNQTKLAIIGYTDGKFVFCQYPITYKSITKKIDAIKFPKRITVKQVQRNPNRDIVGSYSYQIEKDNGKSVVSLKTMSPIILKLPWKLFGNKDCIKAVNEAKSENIQKGQKRAKGVQLFNIIVKVIGVEVSPGDGSSGRPRPDKIEAFIMNDKGVALVRGTFNCYIFQKSGINQIQKGMLLLFPMISLRKSTYWTDGIYLEADIQYTMFNAAVFKGFDDNWYTKVKQASVGTVKTWSRNQLTASSIEILSAKEIKSFIDQRRLGAVHTYARIIDIKKRSESYQLVSGQCLFESEGIRCQGWLQGGNTCSSGHIYDKFIDGDNVKLSCSNMIVTLQTPDLTTIDVGVYIGGANVFNNEMTISNAKNTMFQTSPGFIIRKQLTTKQVLQTTKHHGKQYNRFDFSIWQSNRSEAILHQIKGFTTFNCKSESKEDTESEDEEDDEDEEDCDSDDKNENKRHDNKKKQDEDDEHNGNSDIDESEDIIESDNHELNQTITVDSDYDPDIEEENESESDNEEKETSMVLETSDTNNGNSDNTNNSNSNNTNNSNANNSISDNQKKNDTISDNNNITQSSIGKQQQENVDEDVESALEFAKEPPKKKRRLSKAAALDPKQKTDIAIKESEVKANKTKAKKTTKSKAKKQKTTASKKQTRAKKTKAPSKPKKNKAKKKTPDAKPVRSTTRKKKSKQ